MRDLLMTWAAARAYESRIIRRYGSELNRR